MGSASVGKGCHTALLLMGQNGYQVQLLAPAQVGPIVSNTSVATDAEMHGHYLSSLQRLRARTYLEDGAIDPRQVDSSGRFWMDGDEDSWHFLLVDEAQQAVACIRLFLHENTTQFEKLRLRHSGIAKDPQWSTKLRAAVEEDLAEARRASIGYAELGGWAIAPEHRCTKAALVTLVASYAWGQMVGGCLSSCTATVRHGSAKILRRIGGKSYLFSGEAIPPYTDPQYGCLMEILRFDSRDIDHRFEKLVAETREKLEASTIIRPSLSTAEEFIEEVSVRQSLLALGTATRQRSHRFEDVEIDIPDKAQHHQAK